MELDRPSFWSELKRRHVVRAGLGYLIVGAAVGGAAADFIPGLGAPEWVLRVVLTMLVLGFPVALVLAWAYQVTGGEVRRESDPVLVPAAGLVSAEVEESAPAETAADSKAIAVLPFTHFSSDEADEFFADGVTDDILTRLAQVSELHVISRTSVMQYKGTKKPIAQIAGELGVGTVLEGSVRRSGDRVRIVAQLIEATTDRHLWAEKYDRDLTDIFAVQADVAEHIADALASHLAPEERERIRRPLTTNLEAYDRYVRGRGYMYRLRPEDVARGVELLEEAVALDPGFAVAHAQLSIAYGARAYYGSGNPVDEFALAEETAGRALDLDPESGLAWAARGFARYHTWRWADAEADLIRARELDPGFVDVLFFLGHLRNAGCRHSEAIEPLEAAKALAPREVMPPEHLCIAYYHAGEQERALDLIRRAIELDPGHFEPPMVLGGLLVNEGRFREGIDSLEKAVEIAGGGFWPKGWLAAAHHMAGQTDEARRLGEDLQESGGPVGAIFSAIVEDDLDRALKGLEGLADVRHPLLFWFRCGWPWMDKLLDEHPGWGALKERVWGVGG